MLDVRDAEGGSTLRVRVSPRASRNAVAGERDGALVVRVTAAPVEGAANEALARVLSKVLHVPAAAVAVRHGATGRDKLLHVSGLDADTLRARLELIGGMR
jgi:uncharacterized protein (TIGR00251 family)